MAKNKNAKAGFAAAHGSATIYPSQDAATEALPKCPRPKGGQYDHWWYIDSDRIGESPDYIPCVCGTCGQKMNLSVDAEDYPAT
jgi:hypothetical protein